MRGGVVLFGADVYRWGEKWLHLGGLACLLAESVITGFHISWKWQLAAVSQNGLRLMALGGVSNQTDLTCLFLLVQMLC